VQNSLSKGEGYNLPLASVDYINSSAHLRRGEGCNNGKNLFTYLPIHLFTSKKTGLLRFACNDVNSSVPQCLSNLMPLTPPLSQGEGVRILTSPRERVEFQPQGSIFALDNLFI